ncbi:MAG: S-adenosylmethionine:tRNA ribosyltransferase-isomerase, partial [Sphingobacteriales bacterium]
TYRRIADHLPSDSLCFFNQTRVVNARLRFRKPTGGQIEVFCLEPDESYPDVPTAMASSGSVLWKCMIGGAGKWKQGQVLTLELGDLVLNAGIAARQPGFFIVRLSWKPEGLSFAEVLEQAGTVPLPPYMQREADSNDTLRYQTVFSTSEGSVAAPTAGLHFTPGILDELAAKGIQPDFLTLHVGAGTFKPVKSATMEGHEMHAEWIEVSRTSIELLMNKNSGPVVAVGTTALRTLESLYWIGAKLHAGIGVNFQGVAVEQWDPYYDDSTCTLQESLTALMAYITENDLQKIITRTRIIIAPGYKMRVVSGLITNFHQPESTLLLLVAAHIGDDWHKVYDYALQHRLRFLSYGDGSLLWGGVQNY